MYNLEHYQYLQVFHTDHWHCYRSEQQHLKNFPLYGSGCIPYTSNMLFSSLSSFPLIRKMPVSFVTEKYLFLKENGAE